MSVKRYVQYINADGSAILVEVEDETAAALTGTRVPAGGTVDKKIEVAGESLQHALGPIKTVVQSVINEIASLTQLPEEVTVEFGIKLAGTVGVVLASGSAEANLTLTMTWRADRLTPG
jgi:hypothetical protein